MNFINQPTKVSSNRTGPFNIPSRRIIDPHGHPIQPGLSTTAAFCAFEHGLVPTRNSQSRPVESAHTHHTCIQNYYYHTLTISTVTRVRIYVLFYFLYIKIVLSYTQGFFIIYKSSQREALCAATMMHWPCSKTRPECTCFSISVCPNRFLNNICIRVWSPPPHHAPIPMNFSCSTGPSKPSSLDRCRRNQVRSSGFQLRLLKRGRNEGTANGKNLQGCSWALSSRSHG